MLVGVIVTVKWCMTIQTQYNDYCICKKSAVGAEASGHRSCCIAVALGRVDSSGSKALSTIALNVYLTCSDCAHTPQRGSLLLQLLDTTAPTTL
jgi:hypothetical protein